MCLSIITCCGPPAYGLELPDSSKPGGALPGRSIVLPKPIVTPDAVPQVKKRAARQPQGSEARIRVTRIELVGVVERPDLDIHENELMGFVEQLRRQKIEKAKHQLETPMRLKKDDKLLKKIEKIAESAQDKDDREILEGTIQQFRARELLDESLSLKQLQEIAASVAQYYRDRGFILVQAFIPPQTISSGIVQIRILEGIMGHVTVEKNQRFTEEQLLEPFHGLTGKPVTKAGIEEAMLLLNDYPGLKTFAVFRPGIYTGETDLLVSVIKEDPVSANIHGDNYGSIYTGEYRGRYDLTLNNPFNAIDRLIGSVSKTASPSNGQYLGLVYERRSFGPKNIFGLNISQNTYSLGGDLTPFGIRGTTIQAGASWRRSFKRSRLINSYGLLQFNRKSAKLDITEGRNTDDDLSVLSAELGFNWTGAMNRHASNGWIKFSKGFPGLLNSTEPTNDPALAKSTRRGGSGDYTSSDFSKTEVDIQYWMPWKQNQSLHFSLHGQFSGDLLTSLEQMPIGGPHSVRAYPTSEYLRDKAVFGSAEWIIKAPGFAHRNAFGNKRWGEVLEAVLFVDYAKGWLNDPLANDIEEVTLSGIGAGLRFDYDNISARFDVAKAIGGEKPSNDRDPQFFFEVNYGF